MVVVRMVTSNIHMECVLIRMDLCTFVIVIIRGYKFSNDFIDVVTLDKGVCVCALVHRCFFALYSMEMFIMNRSFVCGVWMETPLQESLGCMVPMNRAWKMWL